MSVVPSDDPNCDPAALAWLHARCFADTRCWSAAEIAALVARPEVTALVRPQGFALIRVVAGEAELLTLAVAPEARRCGLGRELLMQSITSARTRDACEMFLEVARDNQPALALYEGAGFTEVGRRPDYFRDGAGRAVEAIVLRRDLTL